MYFPTPAATLISMTSSNQPLRPPSIDDFADTPGYVSDTGRTVSPTEAKWRAFRQAAMVWAESIPVPAEEPVSE